MSDQTPMTSAAQTAGPASIPYQHQAPPPPTPDGPPSPGWWQASDGKWYPPQPPPGKKPVYKRVWFWLLVVVALGFGSCIAVVSAASKAVSDANAQKHTIVYTVTGRGTADITYDSFENGSSGSADDNGAALPWTKTITGSGLFNLYDVSATSDSGSGSIACTLKVDGKVVASQSSSGQFANVDCSGST